MQLTMRRTGLAPLVAQDRCHCIVLDNGREHWLKSKNPAAAVIARELLEEWGR